MIIAIGRPNATVCKTLQGAVQHSQQHNDNKCHSIVRIVRLQHYSRTPETPVPTTTCGPHGEEVIDTCIATGSPTMPRCAAMLQSCNSLKHKKD